MIRPTRPRLAVAVGTAALTLALVLVVDAVLRGEPATAPASRGPSKVAVLVVVAGTVLVAWRLRSRPAPEDPAESPTAEPHDGDTEQDSDGRDAGPATDDGGGEPSYRRAGRYALVDSAPEQTAADLPLAGRDDADRLARAAAVARSAGSVEAGIETVRLALQSALREVLVAGGTSPEEAERIIDEGAWTDDADAAAVLSATVEPPRRSFRERLWTWLRPAAVTRRRLDGAVAAVAATADERLPTVPGQTAPRQVEVSPPTLVELRRAVDGPLRPAVDGPARGWPQRERDDERMTPTAADPSVSGERDGASAMDEPVDRRWGETAEPGGDGAAESSGDGAAEPGGDGERDPTSAADRAAGEGRS